MITKEIAKELYSMAEQGNVEAIKEQLFEVYGEDFFRQPPTFEEIKRWQESHQEIFDIHHASVQQNIDALYNLAILKQHPYWKWKFTGKMQRNYSSIVLFLSKDGTELEIEMNNFPYTRSPLSFRKTEHAELFLKMYPALVRVILLIGL